ncbi:MAG: hypothetical protein M1826_006468 [Phylliscum demangeonii]|nr:MAG: hypothetical protein M1826_006468 [Phylliscum demangeonii]
MADLERRSLLPFSAGDNASDAVINGIHFNRTALDHYHYGLYTNGTLSNDSSCYLAFDHYQPAMFSNGSFANETSCYAPYYGIRQRGILGLVCGCLFAASIIFTIVNLRKHGRRLLPLGKRFRPVGRRWQWYWLLFTAGCGTVSGLVSVDVDRGYLQSLPIVLQNFFYYLMTPAILAAVWESVRHWGSWQERQIYDGDNYSLAPDAVRERTEFWMPLVFYLFGFMNFFMTIPRSWTAIEYQRSTEQQRAEAQPAATDGRFKAAAAFALLAWLVILYSLRHSIHHYRPPAPAPTHPLRRVRHLAHHTPYKFWVLLPLSLVVVGYAIATSIEWAISPLKFDASSGWIYGLGYAPVLLIVLACEVCGYRDENEDVLLIRQRRDRGRVVDAELGILGNQKPAWWHRAGPGEVSRDPLLALRMAVRNEVGGGPSTHRKVERAMEMRPLPTMTTTATTTTTTVTKGATTTTTDATTRAATSPSSSSSSSSSRPESTLTTSSSDTRRSDQAPATRIRSMLDV